MNKATEHIRSILTKTQTDGSAMVCAIALPFYDACDDIDQLVDAYRNENRELQAEVNELREHSIEFPLDADGVPIRVGDSVEVNGDCRGTVLSIKLCLDGWWVYANGRSRRPERYRHYHAPTVVDVLREFVSEFNRDDTELCDEEIIERFAAKLKLADTE